MAKETESRGSYLIHEKDGNSRVIIAEEVFTNIAALTALETEGVVSLAGNITKDQLGRSGAKSLSKCVKVNIRDQAAEIYIALNIHFGYSIPATSAKVQERVESAIENMIGYSVSHVNIKIAGVIVEK